MNKKIVAIGGGENGRLKSNGTRCPYETGPMDQEIIKLTGKDRPNFLFLAHTQSTLESEEEYFNIMHNVYGKMYGCECKILKRIDLSDLKLTREMIDWADIIYEGGGDTKSMVELWKKTGFDKILIQAYENGKVMCGVSAGANCWFKSCSSDALQIQTGDPNAPLIKVDCLNLVDAFFTPHCDEKNRLQHTQELIKTEDMLGIALSNCAAIEIVDDEYRIITSDASYHNIKAYGIKMYLVNGELHQSYIEETPEFRKLEELLSKDNETLNK